MQTNLKNSFNKLEMNPSSSQFSQINDKQNYGVSPKYSCVKMHNSSSMIQNNNGNSEAQSLALKNLQEKNDEQNEELVHKNKKVLDYENREKLNKMAYQKLEEDYHKDQKDHDRMIATLERANTQYRDRATDLEDKVKNMEIEYKNFKCEIKRIENTGKMAKDDVTKDQTIYKERSDDLESIMKTLREELKERGLEIEKLRNEKVLDEERVLQMERKKNQIEYDLGNKLVEAENDGMKLRIDNKDISLRYNKLDEKWKQDKEVMGHHIKELKEQMNEYKSKSQKQLDDAKDSNKQLEKDTRLYKSLLNESENKLQKCVKESVRIEKYYKDKDELLEQAMIFIDDLYGLCRKEKSLGPYLKNFQFKKNQMEKKHKGMKNSMMDNALFKPVNKMVNDYKPGITGAQKKRDSFTRGDARKPAAKNIKGGNFGVGRVGSRKASRDNSRQNSARNSHKNSRVDFLSEQSFDGSLFDERDRLTNRAKRHGNNNNSKKRNSSNVGLGGGSRNGSVTRQSSASKKVLNTNNHNSGGVVEKYNNYNDFHYNNTAMAYKIDQLDTANMVNSDKSPNNYYADKSPNNYYINKSPVNDFRSDDLRILDNNKPLEQENMRNLGNSNPIKRVDNSLMYVDNADDKLDMKSKIRLLEDEIIKLKKNYQEKLADQVSFFDLCKIAFGDGC